MNRKLLLVFALSLFVTASTFGQAQIYEIRIDQPGADTLEYFELAGTPSTDLSALTYLVIGDGSGGTGTVEEVTNLSGQTIPGSGFFVAAEAEFNLSTPDLVTDLNFENSDNVTHMLVSGWSGSDGDDLDTNDDGTLDVTPWTSIVDCVALVEDLGSGEMVYCATQVGPDGTFVPGHVYWSGSGYNIGAFEPTGGDDTPGGENNLPVELADFSAMVDGDATVLTWETLSETGNAGFAVEFKTDAADWSEIGFVEGLGTSATGKTYIYKTDRLEAGTYSFRLKQVDLDGSFVYSPTVEVVIEVGDTYVLTDAYPNPFNPSTTIGFAVSNAQEVSVNVYNLVGKHIATLFDGPVQANESKSVVFEATNLPSGIYLYRIAGEDFSTTRQVVLLK